MNPMFFRELRESRVSATSNYKGSTRAGNSRSQPAGIFNILVIGGHSRQIQDISSIARSLGGGGVVDAVSSLVAAQERILKGKPVDWVVAAIRPFDQESIIALGRLHDRVSIKTDARWMALWPGLRPPENELRNWQVHLSYPASVGQLRRALVGGSADYEG